MIQWGFTNFILILSIFYQLKSFTSSHLEYKAQWTIFYQWRLEGIKTMESCCLSSETKTIDTGTSWCSLLNGQEKNCKLCKPADPATFRQSLSEQSLHLECDRLVWTSFDWGTQQFENNIKTIQHFFLFKHVQNVSNIWHCEREMFVFSSLKRSPLAVNDAVMQRYCWAVDCGRFAGSNAKFKPWVKRDAFGSGTMLEPGSSHRKLHASMHIRCVNERSDTCICRTLG